MKLGKKLGITDRGERAKLLIDGVKIHTEFGGQIYSLTFDEECLYVNDCFLMVTDMSGNHKSLSDYEDVDIWNLDWYYPVDTYTINGVELEDLRVKEGKGDNDFLPDTFYVSTLNERKLFDVLEDVRSVKDVKKLHIERDLLHTTKEAAIAHSRALLGLPQDG